MKKATLAILALVVGCNCVAFGAQMGIGDIAKQGCSVASRGKTDKASVAAFLNKILESDGMGGLNPLELMEFKWIDLAGDGGCELVFMRWGAAVTSLNIYWQDNFQALAGEATLETIDLSKGPQKKIYKSSIRDLDGDGKKEIIMGSYLGGGRRGANAFPAWLQVYRLEGEEYVPASKDFPDFYEREVLPELNEKIAATPQAQETALAVLEMERDKIQRVLGRDPNAGLEKARQWAKSENPELIEDAKDVFLDIGGHEAEVSAAEQAGKEAYPRWIASHPNN
jgi:hypothetical protein